MHQLEKMAWHSLQRGPGEPRVAILVLGCLLTVYDQCIQTIRATWGANHGMQHTANADIFYVYGGQHANIDPDMIDLEQRLGQALPALRDFEVWVAGDTIVCGAADVYAGQQDCILRKRLIAFGYLANQQRYDYVYTVCAASYVDVQALQRYVRGLPSTGVYHGPLNVHQASGSPFVTGASMLLSRDLAADLADNAQRIIADNTDNAPDDVVIGRWIANNYCAESAAEIRGNIAAGQKATGDQTFVIPFGHGLKDYVWSAAPSELPMDQGFHYHFHSARIVEMEDFHRQHFAAR